MSRTRKLKSHRRRSKKFEVTIDRLGRQGDGMARHGGDFIHVALAVPGDRLLVEAFEGADHAPARVIEVIAAGSGRIDPPCPHFGLCGGCRLQHLATDPYRAWKRGIVADALARGGLDVTTVGDVIAIPPNTRRRVTLAARHTRNGVVLGFNQRLSGHIVDLDQCLIAVPEIVRLLPPLRALMSGVAFADRAIDLSVAALDDGIDLVLVGGTEPDLGQRELLAAFAEQHDLARVSWRQSAGRPPEPIAYRRAGVLRMGEAVVVLPPGGFCQASRQGEAALAELVVDAVGASDRVADLFCGVGTFGLRLAAGHRRVVGFDSDPASVAAHESAARQAGFTHRPDLQVRDLFGNPLTPDELDGFDAVIFDPPRAGAKTQAAALARSAVPLVVGVSCNPATFARDAGLLVDGGYRLELVTPVDQFVWSHHVELVGVFRR